MTMLFVAVLICFLSVLFFSGRNLKKNSILLYDFNDISDCLAAGFYLLPEMKKSICLPNRFQTKTCPPAAQINNP
jgi:hypothetical protein